MSYRKLTHRGPDGAMQYSGLYRCSGCSVTFSDPVAWREVAAGGDEVKTEAAHAQSAEPSRSAASTADSSSPSGHSFKTWGLVRPLPAGEPLPYGYNEADTKAIQEAAAKANKSKGRRR